MKGYNGHKSRAHWNASLWLNNDEHMYLTMLGCLKDYGVSIADDYVLGPAWAEIGKSLRTLLNGDCGRLDCGTIDRIVTEEFVANGLTDEGEEKP